jgi:aminoglycoside phosphotransferase (APT) family kinase protein
VREWSAEVVVDEALARRLLRQFPDLAVDSLELIAEGWDNAVWLVDGTWAFRFPRRSIAIPGVEREIAVLPRLAPLLPLPIPVPTFVGRPAHGYPWAFFGARFLPGREVADADLSDDARSGIAGPLGSFLRALHAADAGAFAAELPADPMGRADMTARAPRTRERLDELATLGIWEAPPSVEAVLGEAERLPPPNATVVAHGDFHFRHILVDAAGALCAVIDWGDVCRGDPGIDLPLFWSLFDGSGRAAFLDAYGPVGEDRLLRARVLALFLSAVLAIYARHEGLPSLEREAVAQLARASAH